MPQNIDLYPDCFASFLLTLELTDSHERQRLETQLDDYLGAPPNQRHAMLEAAPLLRKFLEVVRALKSLRPEHKAALQPFAEELAGKTGLVLSRGQIFTLIYQNNLWGSNESLSGSGSELKSTSNLRAILPDVLTRYDIHTLLDAPCGDFHWMKELNLSSLLDQYYGVDIVDSLIGENELQYSTERIRFITMDLVTDVPPRVYLIICRHLMMHLTLKESTSILEHFRLSGSRYLLITSSPQVDRNEELSVTGTYRPVNLRIPPFNLEQPLLSLEDKQYPADPTQLVLYELCPSPVSTP
jgi:hypothetical protein